MSTEFNKMKSVLTNDIRFLLKDYLFFRAAIVFANKKKLTCYGHEHSCSYEQLLHGHVNEIILDAVKGYNDLIKYIETKGKAHVLKSAKIYGRDNINLKFDNTHRVWINGTWQEINDPAFSTGNNIRIMDFEVIKGRVEIIGVREQNGKAKEALPDFKEEISKALRRNND